MEQIFSTGFPWRRWKLQKWIYCGLALLVLLGLTGIWGGGGFWNKVRIKDPSGAMVLEHRRFGHVHAPGGIKVALHPFAGDGKTVYLWIGKDFMEHVHLQEIFPSPLRVESAAGGTVFAFGKELADEPWTVYFEGRNKKSGLLKGQMGLYNPEQPESQRLHCVLDWKEFIYP